MAAETPQDGAEVVIVGGGIAGLATALGLFRLGVRSIVLERHAELRATGAGITLFPNAWHALRALGVEHKLDAYATYHVSTVTDLESGVTQEFPFAGSIERNPLGVRAVDRKALLEALAGDLPEGTIRFGSKVTAIERDDYDSEKKTTLKLTDGTIIRAKVVIGCDGVNSVVAQWLGLSEPIQSGRSAIRGLAVFPDGHGFKTGLRQYLSKGIRAGYMALDSTSLYWFFVNNTTASEGNLYAHPELIQQEVIANLAAGFPDDFLAVVRHSDIPSLTWAPLQLRVPWGILFGQLHRGSTTVAGDAFHPMTPDLGQGGCLALEGCVVLARTLAQARSPEDGVARYVAERRWRAALVVAGSFLSGWVQQGGMMQGVLGGAVKVFRNRVFYPFIFPMFTDSALYNCGELQM